MKSKKVIIFSIIITLLIISPDTFANTSVLDSVLTEFKTEAAKWASPISKAAEFLFFSLGAISLAWTLGMLIVRRAEIGEVFGELVKFSVFFGFMFFILKNAVEIGTSILDSFLSLGSKAGGASSPITASGIVDIGYDIFVTTSKKMSVWSPVESTILGITALLILIALCYVAVTFITIQISAYILLNAGIFILGFGGARWTSEMAFNYYKTLIGIGLQLLTMVLIVTLGKGIMDGFNAKMGGEITFENLSIMLLTAIFLVISVGKIPPMVGGLVSGATGGTSFGGAGMALAGVATAMAAAATAMTTAAASIGKALAANGVGAGQAISEALKLQGNDKSQDTTPDISNINTSSSEVSSDMSSNTQGNSGQDGVSGNDGYQGDKGEDGYSGEDTSSKENYQQDQSIDKDNAQDSSTQRQSEDSTPGVSEQNPSIVDKPRNFGERLKSATAAVGSQIVSDIKSTPSNIKDSLKQSVTNLGTNSYMGRVAQKISNSNTIDEGTGSISGATENKSTPQMNSGKTKTSQILDGVKKSQEW
ncbi:P-type conjugative transfer protein TrbL (plasmid) [Pasteurella multocida]|uniref:P-type conjugative transfer protein TrbL n=1 Tax=Pasteurella multocida TaxID=747 RepID=UPI002ED09768|nr:P-type conjugative transfer protein TrbL [Pasteurella multocida]